VGLYIATFMSYSYAEDYKFLLLVTGVIPTILSRSGDMFKKAAILYSKVENVLSFQNSNIEVYKNTSICT